MQGKKLKVAIISAGMIANAAHIPAYQNLHEDVDLIGICDTNEEAARATAQRHGINNVFVDAKEMPIILVTSFSFALKGSFEKPVFLRRI